MGLGCERYGGRGGVAYEAGGVFWAIGAAPGEEEEEKHGTKGDWVEVGHGGSISISWRRCAKESLDRQHDAPSRTTTCAFALHRVMNEP